MPANASPIQMGFLAFNGSSVVSQGLTTSAIRAAFGFRPVASKTLDSVRVYFSVYTGTLAGSDLECALYSDSSGSPGSSIEARTGSATPAVGVYDFTGFTTALTADTQYWLVFRNTHASPGSNTVTIRAGGTDSGPLGYGSVSSVLGSVWKTSTDSGSSWSAGNRNTCGFRLKYSDSSYGGLMVTNQVAASSMSTTYRQYGKRAVGAKFTTPASARWSVRFAGLAMNKIGSPTGKAKIGRAHV